MNDVRGLSRNNHAQQLLYFLANYFPPQLPWHYRYHNKK